MTLAAATHDEDKKTSERRCIVTGDVLAPDSLVRFVADPDGHVTPDVAGKLPGRGMWVTADSAIVERAVQKNHFSKSAKTHLSAPADLAARVERQLVSRMQGDLGIARRSGTLILGFENVMRALDAKPEPSVLVEASDGAADGRRKLGNAVAGRGLKIAVMDCLSSAELGLALGRENVIHAALLPGGLSERLVVDAARLAGFRTPKPAAAGAGPNPATFERHE